MAAEETQGVPTIDRAYLEANHADLVSAIRAEGHAAGMSEGRTAGAAAERERIQSVRAVGLPGHEALIETLAFDGQTTAADAALAVNQAERTLRLAAQKAILNAPAAVGAAEQPMVDPKTAGRSAEVAAALAKLNAQVAGGA